MSTTAGSLGVLAELHSDRILLRPLTEGDSNIFCEVYSDPDTMRFIGAPASRERAERTFRKVLTFLEQRPIERLFLVVVEKATAQQIGIGSLQELDVQRRRIEVGLMLGTGARGRGFGKEALRAMVNHGLAHFPVDEVWLRHAADNGVAGGPPLSLGLVRNGDVEGKPVWSAFRDSWPPVSNSRGDFD